MPYLFIFGGEPRYIHTCHSHPPPFAAQLANRPYLKKWLPREFWFAKIFIFLLKLHVHVFFSLFFFLILHVISSSPSFVTVYEKILWNFFYKKSRAGNRPKMFKIRMRCGNKVYVRTLLFWWLDILNWPAVFLVFCKRARLISTFIHSIKQRHWPKHLATEKNQSNCKMM